MASDEHVATGRRPVRWHVVSRVGLSQDHSCGRRRGLHDETPRELIQPS